MLVIVSVASCKENDDLSMYENDPKVYFWGGVNTVTADSIGYNFILLPTSQTKDTIYLPLRIMGDVADYDREVELEIVDSSSAKEHIVFEIGPKKVRANSFTDSIPVYINRTPDMTTKILKLYVNLLPSKDFKVGYDQYKDFKVSITDQLVPPTWSFTFAAVFGQFSMVKFRFMVATLQRVTFPNLPSELAAMGSKCKVALAAYEAANGPLYDENGLQVVFP